MGVLIAEKWGGCLDGDGKRERPRAAQRNWRAQKWLSYRRASGREPDVKMSHVEHVGLTSRRSPFLATTELPHAAEEDGLLPIRLLGRSRPAFETAQLVQQLRRQGGIGKLGQDLGSLAFLHLAQQLHGRIEAA